MKECEIPEAEERVCVECSRENSEEELEAVETMQIPVSIEIFEGNRGCFGARKPFNWKWKCTECDNIQR